MCTESKLKKAFRKHFYISTALLIGLIGLVCNAIFTSGYHFASGEDAFYLFLQLTGTIFFVGGGFMFLLYTFIEKPKYIS